MKYQKIKYVDAHAHWSDPRLFQLENRNVLLKKAFEKNINFFLLGGVNPEEWLNQLSLKKDYTENFGLCFGLHPYFVSDHDFEACELALDQMTQLLPTAMALGEAGLDFRPHIMKDSESRQIEMFENQLEIAKAFIKPMVLHIVQAHEKALQIFNMWDAPEAGGFVHAFNGSYDVAKKYIDQGFLISVGGAITFEKNRKLYDCIKKLPLEYLILESDSPDQAPLNWPTELNDSTSLYQIAEKIGLIKNIGPFDVLEVATSNFKRLFRL